MKRTFYLFHLWCHFTVLLNWAKLWFRPLFPVWPYDDFSPIVTGTLWLIPSICAALSWIFTGKAKLFYFFNPQFFPCSMLEFDLICGHLCIVAFDSYSLKQTKMFAIHMAIHPRDKCGGVLNVARCFKPQTVRKKKKLLSGWRHWLYSALFAFWLRNATNLLH